MGQASELLRTALNAAARQMGARMVDYAGWEMPLLFTGILDEHLKTRTDATVFDVSHMGRLRIAGDYAFKLLDRACTAEVVGQEDNTARYSLLCNEQGGVIDDIFLLRLEDHWVVVCNAANREKVLAHLNALNEQGGFGAKVEDTTLRTGMLAVQGPRALEKLTPLVPMDLAGVGRHQVLAGSHLMFHYVASRTGYTGEDGFEVVLPTMAAQTAWKMVTSEKGGIAPAGLGARDVLRLEAGLPLYGHELNETVDPISAGLEKAVREKGDFVGAAAIAKVRERGPARRLVGIRLQTNRIARQGAVIYADGWEVGVVTSGTYGPSCEASIAMGYVDRQFAGIGQVLVVQIKPEEEVEAEIVPRPFYRGSAYQKR